ncbi:unnamed protein product [Citrullus colocynthis]|uniref:Uncharacterized protein n=1 Tax=Citrullus colocynthis TaxID=252529 RepID=A0ABP0YFS2_9ROSI
MKTVINILFQTLKSNSKYTNPFSKAQKRVIGSFLKPRPDSHIRLWAHVCAIYGPGLRIKRRREIQFLSTLRTSLYNFETSSFISETATWQSSGLRYTDLLAEIQLQFGAIFRFNRRPPARIMAFQ